MCYCVEKQVTMRQHLVPLILAFVANIASAQKPYDSSRDSLFVFMWETTPEDVSNAFDRAHVRAATSVELREFKQDHLDHLRRMMSVPLMHTNRSMSWTTIVALGADKRSATELRYDPDQQDTFVVTNFVVDPNTVWPAGVKFLAKRK